MNKFICILSSVLCLSSLCFAVPSQPTDKSSFSTVVPSHSLPPTPRTTYAKPTPTNKWFNSIIYTSDTNNTSVRMFLYPQCYKCDSGLNKGTWQLDFSRGLVIAYPKLQYNVPGVPAISYDGATWGQEEYPDNIKISAYNSISNGDFIVFDPMGDSKVDRFTDFSATIKWTKNDKWMKSTIGQGLVFSYFEYSDSVYPTIEFPYAWEASGNIHLYKPDGTEISNAVNLDTENSDKIILETRFKDGSKVFYGIFVPQNTSFKQASMDDNLNRIFLELPNGQKYFSIGLLPSKNITEAISDLALYYKYAYNFVTNTKVDWKVNSDYSSQTNFNLTVTKKRTDIVDQQDGTLFCLFPHQYDNLVSSIDIISGKTFNTLRGEMKLVSGTTFSTKTKFYGIVPFFQYDTKEIKSDLTTYLTNDNNEVYVSSVSANPYRAGKVIAKLANMLPIADNINDSSIKNSLIVKLKALLKDWLTYSNGEEGKYFAYDTIWGGLEGIRDDEFYSFNYNDHHFHYGYFIYSAAILAMYDNSFAKDYGQMVNLLIKDIANTDRNDTNFPYMRHYDFYESHSWANGMGGANNFGIDQESSSEAMNTWSAIYLWGLITGNKSLENLGIYLYSNEYEAIKYYYFDIDKNILKGEYKYNSVGRLWGGCVSYDLWFWPLRPQSIKGIQILPMTPAMTYLAYDKTYIQEFYESTLTETIGDPDPSFWYDIWARLIALYDPLTALQKFNNYKETVAVDEGSSKSFTYYFINFFKNCGTPNFTYTADTSSYIVLEKDGTTSYGAYNPSSSYKNIHFYNSLGEDLGYLPVSAKSFLLSSKLVQGGSDEKISVFPVPYKPKSGGKYDAKGITFLGVTNGTNIKIFNIAGEKVFEETISGIDNTFVWNAKNNAGNDIASGIYFYYIKTASGKKVKGKLAIER